jgi:hypothetical protein
MLPLETGPDSFVPETKEILLVQSLLEQARLGNTVIKTDPKVY